MSSENEPLFDFDMYRGQPIAAAKTSYLEWLLRRIDAQEDDFFSSFDPWFVEYLRWLLARRKAAWHQKASPHLNANAANKPEAAGLDEALTQIVQEQVPPDGSKVSSRSRRLQRSDESGD
jgi:hypothetical protein